jgi:acetate kinase
MRKRILSEMESLGIEVDEQKNKAVVGKEGEIQTDKGKIKVFVIPTNEELAIARDTYQTTIDKKN